MISEQKYEFLCNTNYNFFVFAQSLNIIQFEVGQFCISHLFFVNITRVIIHHFRKGAKMTDNATSKFNK